MNKRIAWKVKVQVVDNEKGAAVYGHVNSIVVTETAPKAIAGWIASHPHESVSSFEVSPLDTEVLVDD